jgi:hypothetical protein
VRAKEVQAGEKRKKEKAGRAGCTEWESTAQGGPYTTRRLETAPKGAQRGLLRGKMISFEHNEFKDSVVD